MNANFVNEITVKDPKSNADVQLSVFHHENGGMFAVDSSFLDQCFDEDENPIIPDPFNPGISVELMGL